jgi:NAD(P)-dependent dehydrogenase (short-subunit alcohol dehydrogenase family)/acyl carrier protein
LPTYPFQHEPYRLAWPAEAASNVDLGKKKSDVTDWFYYPSWKRAPGLHAEAMPLDACWILFLDDCGLGAELAERLRAEGQDVFTVTASEEFERTGEYSFTLNPGKLEHYDALLKQFHTFDKTPANIVHLWGTVPNEGRSDLDNADVTMERTFYSLMFLAKSLGSQYATTPIRLSVLSNSLFDVVGDAVVSPSRATLLGPCKTIPQEYRNISSRSIDVHIPENPAERSELIDALIREFIAGSDDLVAYRRGQRWLQIFEPLPVDAPAGNAGLREGGVYLITGGMGGIGLVLAEYLAQAAHAKLVLIGRSAFPEKAQWQEWLAGHGSDDPVSVKIRKLQDLESLGAEVLLLSGDVVDLGRMSEIVRLVKERFGGIHGVVHAAGIAGDGIIELKTKEISDEVLNPKVKGTLVLEQVLQNIKLDFFVLCSSVASLLPNPGQIDYTAANAFLDAYAYSKQNHAGGAPIAINWDRWDEIGMAVTKAGVASAYSAGADKRKLEAIEHPIFSARTKDAAGETYILQLSPENSWVIGEHKVGGYHTLVGTAYLEFARSAFAVRTEGPVEIRDVIFMFPLMMKQGDSREVEVRLKSSGGRTEFLIRSRLEGKPWQEHAMGKIAKAVGEAKSREHGLEVIQLCKREVAVDFLNAKDGAHIPEQKFIQTGKRWKSLRTVHLGKDEGVNTRSGSYDAIAKLELPAEFVGDLEGYPLHPALMDQATGWAIDVAVQGVNYLPFSYKKVRINKPLPQTFYSYAKLMSDNYEEFMTFDLLVVDEQGEVLVEIETFDLKHMRGQMVFSGEAAGAGTDSRAADQADGAQQGLKRDRWGDHILTKEGIEVFRRILAMPRTPQIAVATKDFSYLLAESKPKDLKAEESDAQAPMLAALHARPNLATPYVAPRNDLEESIAQIWQGVLGIDKVGVNDSFVELGGHSLMAIQLAARIREIFEIELSVAKLYNAPTVAGLATAIVETLVEQSDASVMEQALHELEVSAEGATETRELATSGAD